MPEMISKYIGASEAICHHCNKLPPGMVKNESGEWPEFYDSLFYRFDHLREVWGKAIPVTSFYRCPDHEFEVSGSRLSPHIWGAIDCGISIQEQPQFVAMVESNHPEMRMGTNVHPGSVHVHLDCMWLLHPVYSPALIAGMRWIE